MHKKYLIIILVMCFLVSFIPNAMCQEEVDEVLCLIRSITRQDARIIATVFYRVDRYDHFYIPEEYTQLLLRPSGMTEYEMKLILRSAMYGYICKDAVKRIMKDKGRAEVKDIKRLHYLIKYAVVWMNKMMWYRRAYPFTKFETTALNEETYKDFVKRFKIFAKWQDFKWKEQWFKRLRYEMPLLFNPSALIKFEF